MGRPAHSPELYDELQKKVFLGILEEIYDELPEWVYERVYESGLIRTAMTRKEEERGEEEIN